MDTPEFRREALGGGITALVSDSFSFGTDALLLAAFACECAPHARRAADLGTGCGVIPLLWARDRSPQRIDAVELQPGACALLREAVRENGLEERISVWCTDLRDHALAAGAYDLVACNPPYFRSGAGGVCRDEERRAARTEQSATLPQVCASAARLLRAGGRFCLCHRTQRLAGVMSELRLAGLEPKRLRFVETAPRRPPKLFLLCAVRGAKEGLSLEPPVRTYETISGAGNPSGSRGK